MYYGWRLVVIAAIANMLTMGATYSALGLFVIPVSQEFGLSRAEMNSALILMNLGGAAFSPFLGRLLDRISARLIMTIGALLFGASFLILGISQSVTLDALVIALPLAIAVPSAGALTSSVLLARWFAINRGRAMVLSALGMSVGSIIMTPVIGWLLEQQGWRTTLMITGVMCTVILLGLSTVIRERPGPEDVEPGATPEVLARMQTMMAGSGNPMTIGEILRMPNFWTICLSSSLAMGLAQSLSITFVPLAMDHGLSVMEATSLMSITGISAIVGILALSGVADKIERSVILTAFYVLGAVLNLLLLFADGFFMLAGCAVMLGVAAGAMGPVFYALVADQFGTASFGTVRGLMAPFLAIFGAILVRFAGEIFDRTGHYDLLFTIYIFAELAAAALMFSTRFCRPKPAVAAFA
ncbi:putative major facilitator superfamily transporter [Caenibius tardaugens NBRC 16725]|uniref:Putative major facilitator superfamily transporter n=1 Tax=Caenibius tardaugens NBRC 16725 TaxID=1219035 RepID=U2YHL9_9SPHN|nr:MFS transporter [Caenibius tardaugens]AZI37341.1 MFS transporter [Caenibius tardaugens NBRC 16725]GAD47402.1 putative major facilitator superfamily transporter [Caenibius tardaugens NBRC 16725]